MLEEVLTDDDMNVREAAAAGLGEIGDERALSGAMPAV